MPLKSQKNDKNYFFPKRIFNYLAYSIGLNKIKNVRLLKDTFELTEKKRLIRIKYSEVNNIGMSGIFLKSIYFQTKSKKYQFRWLSKKQAWTLLVLYNNLEKNAWLEKYKIHKTEINILNKWLKEIDNQSIYQRESVFSYNILRSKELLQKFNSRIPKLLASSSEAKQISKIREFVNERKDDRNEINEDYITNEIDNQTKLFDTIEKNPLTDEQRRSVVIDEDANLVIASAGSGKTSVIVAKTAWLINKKLRKPKNILLLAFARDAKIEMSERLAERIEHPDIEDVNVHTFHSIGLEIISQATGNKPSLSKLADDELALLNFIKLTIGKKLEDETYKNVITKWFSEFFAPYASQFDFDNLGQYWEYLDKNNIRSLKGEKLKSFEECEIANFLYLNGINYVYESDYEHKTSNVKRRQYKPDFYLTDYNIYLEHLGLRGFGRTAPYVNRKEYLQTLRWKRELHKKHDTKLIETFSCEKVQGILLNNLRKKLLNLGVKFNELEGHKIFTILEEKKQIDPLTSLMKTFLGHFKGALLNEVKVREIGASIHGAERNSAFIDVFMPIFNEYQSFLKKEKAIDFHDMISMATEAIIDKKYKSKFCYILVDEFQDISSGRAKLISALQDYSSDVQIFCVGDDWQAIFRFAGSDINLMKNFGENFGVFERSDLTTTFRCENKITIEATDFILKNDFQIPKAVNSTNIINQPAIYICFKETDEEILLQAIMKLIVENENSDKTIDVLILGRYKLQTYKNAFDINYGKIINQLNKSFNKLNINFKTVHRSKGLEADYVIILDVISSFLGFPNEKADDHILNMVLSEPEAFPNSEERRLFYVALTRAKKKVFINTQSGSVSTFVSEIIQSPHEFNLIGKNPDDEPDCNECVQGKLKLKEGSFGSFWGCSNYPYCKNLSKPCPHCHKGYPRRIDSGEVVCKICEQTVESCPKKDCNGWLEQRTGKYGPFWGCTEYTADKKPCSFTKDIRATSIIQKKPIQEIKLPVTAQEITIHSTTHKNIKTNTVTSKSNGQSAYHIKLQKIKEIHPNAYQPWKKSEDEKLKELFVSGKKVIEISKILGRQPSAIHSRLKKTGLKDG